MYLEIKPCNCVEVCGGGGRMELGRRGGGRVELGRRRGRVELGRRKGRVELGRRRGRVELGRGWGGGMIMDRLALQPVADSSSNPEQFTYAFICGFEAYTLVYHTSLCMIPLNGKSYNLQ